MSQFSQLYMPRKAIQILLSLVSVFSFVLVSYSTVFLPLFSTFSMKLFSYSSERNYIFLLCNGILVFIIKNSGLIGKSSLVTDHINYNHVKETSKIHIHVPKPSQIKPVVLIIQADEPERKQNALLVSTACNENANSNNENEAEQLLDINQEDDNNYCKDDNDEEGRNELNKRCEEFIRRMKEDIKTQARQVE